MKLETKASERRREIRGQTDRWGAGWAIAIVQHIS